MGSTSNGSPTNKGFIKQPGSFIMGEGFARKTFWVSRQVAPRFFCDCRRFWPAGSLIYAHVAAVLMRTFRPLTHLVLAAFLAACSDGIEPPDLAPVKRPVPRDQSRPVRLVAVGDILLADAAQDVLDRAGYDYPFRYLRGSMPEHDLLLGNLEGPITEQAVPISTGKAFVYKARVQAATALRDFGFDVLDLANNHTLDYRLAGMLDTQAALEAAGIGYFGSGRNLGEAIQAKVIEVAGLRVGFLGFMQHWSGYVSDYPFYAAEDSPGVPMASRRIMVSAIERIREQVDTLVVSMHWGRNYSDVRDNQVRLGRLAVDLGADIVIGHNSHNLQGMEVYRGVPILYSLGNFTFGTNGHFDQLKDPLWHHGWIADVRFERGRATQVDLTPIAINNAVVDFQPRFAAPSLLPGILELVNARFGTPMSIAGNSARWTLTESAFTKKPSPGKTASDRR